MEAVNAEKGGEGPLHRFHGHKDRLYIYECSKRQKRQFRFDRSRCRSTLDAHFRSFTNHVLPKLVKNRELACSG